MKVSHRQKRGPVLHNLYDLVAGGNALKVSMPKDLFLRNTFNCSLLVLFNIFSPPLSHSRGPLSLSSSSAWHEEQREEGGDQTCRGEASRCGRRHGGEKQEEEEREGLASLKKSLRGKQAVPESSPEKDPLTDMVGSPEKPVEQAKEEEKWVGGYLACWQEGGRQEQRGGQDENHLWSERGDKLKMTRSLGT